MSLRPLSQNKKGRAGLESCLITLIKFPVLFLRATIITFISHVDTKQNPRYRRLASHGRVEDHVDVEVDSDEKIRLD